MCNYEQLSDTEANSTLVKAVLEILFDLEHLL